MKLIKITSTEKKHYVGRVYDLTIATTHSYNINGIAVHNSVCETKTETGIYMPMVSALEEAYVGRNEYVYVQTMQFLAENPTEEFLKVRNGDDARKLINYITLHPMFKEFAKKTPLIIADGGIKTPADLCKALAAGADLVMVGGIFAGTEEAPGNVINDNGHLVKLYRGAASFGVQSEHNDKEPDYIEGRESFISYKGKVAKVIKRFKNGLASCMSYMNARTLEEFRSNSFFIEL